MTHNRVKRCPISLLTRELKIKTSNEQKLTNWQKEQQQTELIAYRVGQGARGTLAHREWESRYNSLKKQVSVTLYLLGNLNIHELWDLQFHCYPKKLLDTSGQTHAGHS